MSHFSVLVIQDEHSADIETMLAPYDENLKVEKFITRTREDLLADERHAAQMYKNNEAGFAECVGEEFARYYIKALEAEDDEALLALLRKDPDYADRLDEDGNEFGWHNPNAKWDWWTVGGRWTGHLTTKNKDSLNQGYLKDLVFEPNKEQYEYAKRFWEVVVEGDELREGESDEDYWNYFKIEFYKEFYGDKETYARFQSNFSTHAVVTPDGEWHEVGKMYMFGVSDETADEWKDWNEHYYEWFLEGRKPSDLFTIVDCHI